MSKHTAGPWSFRKTYSDYDEGGEYVHPEQPVSYKSSGYTENPSIFGADGEAVVGNDEYDVFSGPNREANIRLLLAAPDLLAALQGVVRVADRATVEFDAARAAIQKALGGDAPPVSPAKPVPVWERYGLTEAEWADFLVWKAAKSSAGGDQ